jgi:hypothetical protein
MSDIFDYAAIRATADRLITKFGQTVQLRRAVDSGSASEPTQTVTDYPTKCAIVNITRWYAAFAENSDILRTDRLGYLAMGPLLAAAIEPTPFDQVVDTAGKVYRIIDSKPVYPAGTSVVYILQLRT